MAQGNSIHKIDGKRTKENKREETGAGPIGPASFAFRRRFWPGGSISVNGTKQAVYEKLESEKRLRRTLKIADIIQQTAACRTI